MTWINRCFAATCVFCVVVMVCATAWFIAGCDDALGLQDWQRDVLAVGIGSATNDPFPEPGA